MGTISAEKVHGSSGCKAPHWILTVEELDMKDVDHARRHAGVHQDCRLGDWQHVSFVYEWRGKTGVQKYQPANRERKKRCSFNEAEFSPDVPVWKFQRQIWPGMTSSSDTWEVWLRIE